MNVVRRLTSVVVLLCALTGVALAQGANPLESTQNAFRAIHKQVAPAVVSISSRIVEENEGGFSFGPVPRTPRTRDASGSGLIIREEGIVLTNSHVVANATRVTVQLSNGSPALPAEVVQTDPRTDLAIVRITTQGKYPAVKLGDATTVEPGDWAIAFGSPFRLSTTMTVGVISATGRDLTHPRDEFTYRDLLQTDAAINPGNSGGPLVNIRGEVIGVNFMIFSPGDSAGNVGIGFAIPVNDFTKEIIGTLVTGRPYERGLVGVRITNLNPTLRQQYGVTEGGIFVLEVVPGSAAERAGLKAEDVILQYGDTTIADSDQFIRLVERTRPGTKVAVVVMREQQRQTVSVTVGGATSGADTALAGRLGMTVAEITAQAAAQLGLPVTRGVIITRVEEGSLAEQAGLRARDIITRVGPRNGGEDVRTPADFWGAIDRRLAVPGAEGVLLFGYRGNSTTFWTVTRPK